MGTKFHLFCISDIIPVCSKSKTHKIQVCMLQVFLMFCYKFLNVLMQGSFSHMVCVCALIESPQFYM